MTQKIRIKDIAALAGVSVGTVDRVLHNRPNVSPPAREKVEKALKEMNYKPNMYASALAYNKAYRFEVIMPTHDSEAYWEEIEHGTHKVMEHRSDFRIEVSISYYERFDAESFSKVSEQILAANPDGIVIVPSTLEITRKFTDQLHERKIPFVMLDSYMPDLKPLSFFGQDSFSSGYFAARMLMLIASGDSQVAIIKRTQDGQLTSRQQANREVGFRHYMLDHCPGVEILELQLPVAASRKRYDALLEAFFDAHPALHHCIILSSRAHIVGDFLLRTNRREIQVMGYDVLDKNARCLREGSISFLIAQHAYQQGFNAVDTLFKAIVLKQKVNAVNFMPIELLSRENIDYYRRTQL